MKKKYISSSFYVVYLSNGQVYLSIHYVVSMSLCTSSKLVSVLF